MALSDCPKCWDTPCSCGYMYEGMTAHQIQKQIDALEKILAKKLLVDFRKPDTWDGPGGR